MFRRGFLRSVLALIPIPFLKPENKLDSVTVLPSEICWDANTLQWESEDYRIRHREGEVRFKLIYSLPRKLSDSEARDLYDGKFHKIAKWEIQKKCMDNS